MTNQHENPSPSHFFNQEMADSYDRKNSRLAPISDNLYFLVDQVLADLSADARLLCVGVGTGAEILSLAETHRGWSFVGVDPSAEMLNVCRHKLKPADVLHRCELVHGYVDQAPAGAEFDAVLSMFVAHFVARNERVDFYRNIYDRLKTGGYFVSTEICFDLGSDAFPEMLENWKRIQSLMGATSGSLEQLSDTLHNTLCVLSPAETQTMLKTTGFRSPAPFFQAFLIRGFLAKK